MPCASTARWRGTIPTADHRRIFGQGTSKGGVAPHGADLNGLGLPTTRASRRTSRGGQRISLTRNKLLSFHTHNSSSSVARECQCTARARTFIANPEAAAAVPIRAVPFGRHGLSALLDFQEPHHAAAAVRDALDLGAKLLGLALDIREVVQVR